MNDDLQARLPQHFAIATALCLTNMPHSEEWTRAGRSDRFWLRKFSDPNAELTPDLMSDFINQYTLHRQGRWNFPNLIKLLNQFGRNGTSCPKAVENLAIDLGKCLPQRGLKEAGQRGQTIQPSAASKFAFFCQPKGQHYIFDSIAVAAIEVRANSKKLTSYSEFHKLAVKQFKCGMEQLLEAFEDYKKLQSCEKNCEIDLDFHQRYFFDKLLLAQGSWVLAERERRRALPDPSAVRRR